VIALTSGYSRDHRADLKLWMGALSPTPDRDVPLFLQPLAGNGRATVSLLAAVMALQKPLREADGEACVSVAENGISGEATMRRWNRDGVTQVSQVSETMTEVHTLLPQEEQVNDAPIWLLEEDPEEEMVECNTRLPG
jgi:transposase